LILSPTKPTPWLLSRNSKLRFSHHGIAITDLARQVAQPMSHPHWNWSFAQKLASDTSLTSDAIESLLERLRADAWDDRDIFGVHLAVEEALVNAMKHGNQCCPEKYVQLDFRLNGQSVQIEIADEGPGFDPTTLPDPTDAEHIDEPNGRGIMLMRSFMSRVEFNERGNRVLLEKQRSK